MLLVSCVWALAAAGVWDSSFGSRVSHQSLLGPCWLWYDTRIIHHRHAYVDYHNAMPATTCTHASNNVHAISIQSPGHPPKRHAIFKNLPGALYATTWHYQHRLLLLSFFASLLFLAKRGHFSFLAISALTSPPPPPSPTARRAFFGHHGSHCGNNEGGRQDDVPPTGRQRYDGLHWDAAGRDGE